MNPAILLPSFVKVLDCMSPSISKTDIMVTNPSRQRFVSVLYRRVLLFGNPELRSYFSMGDAILDQAWFRRVRPDRKPRVLNWIEYERQKVLTIETLKLEAWVRGSVEASACSANTGQLQCKFARRKIAAACILRWTRRRITRPYANLVARKLRQSVGTRWVLPTYIAR
jgi:hypothetical protein